jgi:hypothetical protein
MTNASLTNEEWIAWRVQLKRMFDLEISIAEILSAIDEATDKKKWPGGTAFWHRVCDVVLKNRHEARPTVKTDDGPSSMHDILLKRFQ